MCTNVLDTVNHPYQLTVDWEHSESQVPRCQPKAKLASRPFKDRFQFTMLTLFCTGLNTPTKRQRLSDWMKEQAPTTCCLQNMYFKHKDPES